MDTQNTLLRLADESSHTGQSLISRAMAKSQMQLSKPRLSTPNGRGNSLKMYHCPRCGRYISGPSLLAHAKAEEYFIGLIKRDHPEWAQSNGTCPPCKVYYRTLVERTGI